jgi:acyl carrier protein
MLPPDADRNAIFQEVIDTIAEVLSVPRAGITAQSRFLEDLGATSLDLAAMLMLLEEELHVQLPDQEARRLVSVDDAVEFVWQRLSGRKEQI